MEITYSFGLIALTLMAFFVPVRGKSLLQGLVSRFSVASTATVLGSDPVPKSKRVTAFIAVSLAIAALAFAVITSPVVATVAMVAAFTAAWAVTLSRTDTVRFNIARLHNFGAHLNDPAHRPRDYTSINGTATATLLTGLGAALIRLVTVGDPLSVFVSVTVGFAAVFWLVTALGDALNARGIYGANAHPNLMNVRTTGLLIDLGNAFSVKRFAGFLHLAGPDDGVKRMGLVNIDSNANGVPLDERVKPSMAIRFIGSQRPVLKTTAANDRPPRTTRPTTLCDRYGPVLSASPG